MLSLTDVGVDVGVPEGVLVGVDVGVYSRIGRNKRTSSSELPSVQQSTDGHKAQNKKIRMLSLTDVGVDVGVPEGVLVGVDVGVYSRIGRNKRTSSSELPSVQQSTDGHKAQNKKLFILSLTDVGVDVGDFEGLDVGLPVVGAEVVGGATLIIR